MRYVNVRVEWPFWVGLVRRNLFFSGFTRAFALAAFVFGWGEWCCALWSPALVTETLPGGFRDILGFRDRRFGGFRDRWCGWWFALTWAWSRVRVYPQVGSLIGPLFWNVPSIGWAIDAVWPGGWGFAVGGD